MATVLLHNQMQIEKKKQQTTTAKHNESNGCIRIINARFDCELVVHSQWRQPDYAFCMKTDFNNRKMVQNGSERK